MPSRMRNQLAAVVALVFAVAYTNAWAQPKKAPKKDAAKKDKKPQGDEVELTPDPPDPDGLPTGARENPDAPIMVGQEGKKAGIKKLAPSGPVQYPIELKDRPLTLFQGMSEVAIDYPVNVDPFVASGLLRGAYGVTPQVEIGLRYGFGAIDSDGYLEGKTFSIDAGYQLNDWASVRVSIPILVDPFAMGVRIGVPLRFKITKKLAIVGGHDLISFKLSKFVPDVARPTATAALVAEDMRGTTLPAGDWRLLGGIIYQWKRNVAFLADIGVIAPDFSLDDQPVPAHLGVQVSSSWRLDYGVRLGCENLDEARNTFNLALFAAFRI